MKSKTVLLAGVIIISIILVFTFPFIRRAKTQENKIEVTVIFEHVFKKCGHVESYTSPQKEVFNSMEELGNAYPSWKIKTAVGGNVYLEKSSDSYCNNHYKIKLSGNKITVTRLKDSTIHSEFYISLKYLTREDISELEKGKTVNSQQELTEFTEDFTS